MSTIEITEAPLRHTDSSSSAASGSSRRPTRTIDVIDSATEELFFSVAEAQAADIDRAVAAAREAFDHGPWPRMTHAERAEYLRAIGRRSCASAATTSPRSGRANRACCTASARRRRAGDAADLRLLRRPRRDLPFEEAGPADRRRRVRAAGARAGRRGRRDHPVERPARR